MGDWRMTVAHSLLDLVFPKDIYCIACGAPLRGGDPVSLCESCRQEILYRQPPVCRRCGRFARWPAADFCEHCAVREPVYDRGAAAVVYEGSVRKILYDLKYGGKGYLADNMAAMMERVLPPAAACDILVPVPMHRSKRAERGYCQTTRIAVCLSRRTGIPLSREALVRLRPTPPMSGLPRDQRVRNVRGAFGLRQPEAFAGKRVLLVDDLLTTGSTADECARVLKEAGAESVFFAAFAAVAPKEPDYS